MNNLKDKSLLLIYDGSNAVYQNWLGAFVAYHAVKYSCDTINIDGLDDTVTTDQVWTLVSALTANSYDKIIVTAAISDGGGSESINYDTLGLLRGLLKTSAQTTAVESGTTTAGAVNSATLEVTSTVSAANDYYNNLWFVSTGGTGAANVVKYCLDYTGATKVLEVGGANWTSPSNDTTYNIYNETNILVAQDPALLVSTALKYNSKASTYGDLALVWDFVCYNSTTGVTNPYPLLIHVLASPLYYLKTGTASAGAATSFTTSGMTANQYVGKFAFIISGTGAGQWAKIASNTTTVVTCEKFNNINDLYLPNYYNVPDAGGTAWTTNPDNTSVFYIIDGSYEILFNAFFQLFAKSFLYDITNSTQQALFTRLIDFDYKLRDNTTWSGSTTQDPTAIEEMIYRGLSIYKGILKSAAIT